MFYRTAIAAALVAAALAAGPAGAASSEEKLARKSGCFKCHTFEKPKDGPIWPEIAKKYRGDKGAEDKLVKHATTSPKVKIDGKEHDHEKLKSDDQAEVRAVVRWILAQ